MTLDELEKLAREATPGDRAIGVHMGDAKFYSAINPDVVLALVAVARRAETMRNAFVNGHDSIAAVTLAKLGEDITALTAALATR
jgi:hypothetical protein